MLKHVISQLGHVEVHTPKPDESLWFFRDVLGMDEIGRDGQSVYLRAWGEHFHNSLKLTAADEGGLGHVGWRADSQEALETVVSFLETSGAGRGWIDGDIGHGPAYAYETPDGHRMEVFWEVEWFDPPAEMRSPIKNRPQKYVGRGAAVRKLDHVTLFASDVTACREFSQELGFRHHEGIFVDGVEQEIGAWLAVTNRDHDTAYVLDGSGSRGRLNHIAYWQDTREEVLRTADILRDAEITIEFGPYRHALSEGFFLYCYEPGGNRVEIYSGGYLNMAPDWGPVKWYISENPGVYWTGDLPQSLFTYGTPPVEIPEQPHGDSLQAPGHGAASST